jgi:hypothetical protein
MPSNLSDPWTYAVALIEMYAGANRLASGSSFLWEHEGRSFLLSNWHNFSGRNPLTNKLMATAGVAPDSVSLRLFRQVSEPDEEGFYELEDESHPVPLIDIETKPLWLEHPTYGRRVDIAALDVTEAVREFKVAHANTLEDDAVLDVATTHDVFVVGYPFGRITGAPAPIWKRGSIALDPQYEIEGLPKILIDTATREGMSGSMVIGRHIVVGRSYQKKDGSQAKPILYGSFDVVLGIYSGRHYPDLEKAQLGIVWKRRLIEEIVATGVRPESSS